MKKLIALLLVAVMALGMAACSGSNEETTTEATDAQVSAASALEVLETVWGQYADEEKFAVMGGYSLDADGIPTTVDGAPGTVEDVDFLTYNLLVSQELQADVTEAASLMHAMNANTFTCGAYAVADAETFANAMAEAVRNNQWICGMPESLLIANVGGFVVVAYGVNDAMTPFTEKLQAAYPGAEVLVSEAIEG